jgi:fused signal recognition particle receptor
MSLFQKFKEGLKKTSAKLAGEIKRIVTRGPKLDPESLEELEAALIGSDIGVDSALRVVERVREVSRSTGQADVLAIARAEIERELTGNVTGLKQAANKPTVVLIAGVNGAGKTTTAAKLAHVLQGQGKTVMLGACDTFRAAAIEQLKIWGERLKCKVVAGEYGADSSAVAFDAYGAAANGGADYLLVDTAGRLHTKKNLMDEIKKMQRTLQKRDPSAPHEVLLVLDATTGNNALIQAREFHAALGLTGLVVTKLDGTAKGGIVVAIVRELKVPVKFIGLGEQLDDLQPFDPKQFAAALFGADEGE